MPALSCRALVRAAVGAVLLGTQLVAAQGPIVARPVRQQPAQPHRIVPQRIDELPGAFEPLRRSGRGVTILGIVQNHLGQLVPNAGIIVVRNLLDGRVVGEVPVNDLAQFTLRGFEPGQYVAELVNANTLLATSTSFTAGVGEVIQLAPVVPVSPVSSFSSVVGNATSSAVTSAASAGVVAVDRGAPVSPR